MREIKFRVWSISLASNNGKMHYLTKENTLEDLIEHDRWFVMQFTGLHDKNGKEIYEGDIVCVSGNINCFKERGEVIFEYGCFFFSGKRFTPKHLTMYPRDLLCECQTTFYTKNTPPEKPLTKFLEVIGNIYENPELLTP
jgi:uncharacterized phage protein (TIGR01671 family)